MQANDIGDLVRHTEWADARTWTCALNLPAMENDDWVRKCFYHFHSTQWAYGQIILGLPVTIPGLDSLPDLKSVGCWAHRFYTEISGRLIELDEKGLANTLEFPWAGLVAKKYGSAHPATVGQSILQFTMHSAHHRGQILHHLREAGGQPPVTDLIAWIWMGNPGPDWGVLAAKVS